MRFETFKFFISACESSNKYTPQGVILLSSATTEKAAEAGWVTVGVVIFLLRIMGIRRVYTVTALANHPAVSRIGKTSGTAAFLQQHYRHGPAENRGGAAQAPATGTRRSKSPPAVTVKVPLSRARPGPSSQHQSSNRNSLSISSCHLPVGIARRRAVFVTGVTVTGRDGNSWTCYGKPG